MYLCAAGYYLLLNMVNVLHICHYCVTHMLRQLMMLLMNAFYTLTAHQYSRIHWHGSVFNMSICAITPVIFGCDIAVLRFEDHFFVMLLLTTIFNHYADICGLFCLRYFSDYTMDFGLFTDSRINVYSGVVSNHQLNITVNSSLMIWNVL